MRKKLFVIVDAFLDKSQQAVQAVHAVAEWCRENPEMLSEWNNEYLIVKKAKNLEAWRDEADSCFREPYWDNKLTAVAAYREEGFAKELPLI